MDSSRIRQLDKGGSTDLGKQRCWLDAAADFECKLVVAGTTTSPSTRPVRASGPRTAFVVCGMDPLRDDALLFASRLEELHDHTHKCFRGTQSTYQTGYATSDSEPHFKVNRDLMKNQLVNPWTLKIRDTGDKPVDADRDIFDAATDTITAAAFRSGRQAHQHAGEKFKALGPIWFHHWKIPKIPDLRENITIEVSLVIAKINRLLAGIERSVYETKSAAKLRPEVERPYSAALDEVTEESLRVWTGVYLTQGEPSSDTVVLGHIIPTGAQVYMPCDGADYKLPQAPGNDWGQLWDSSDIHLVKPEGWLKIDADRNTTSDARAGTNMPFSLGTEACFGKRLAYLELCVDVALLVWNLQLRKLTGQLSSFEEYAKTTTIPQR
ncbi:hypothetical protein GGR56DRAFT_678992 [Xylariaceae sp. FL0804]|nr:hypothetical protein GGR56DRAFT_678992 [Xylariaceae sp. FL0804]